MKYCIISINDRAKNIIEHNKRVLGRFEYVDSIKYCDAKKEDVFNVLNGLKISVDTWAPYAVNRSEPLPGELGIFISLIRIYHFIKQTNTESLLVLEDDAYLDENFINLLNTALEDTPKDFDFLCLYSNDHENSTDINTEIGQRYIHKAKNQGSGILGMVYTLRGANKILDLVQQKGIESTVDDFIFYQVKLGLLDGYIVKKDFPTMIQNFGINIESTIDPYGKRPT